MNHKFTLRIGDSLESAEKKRFYNEQVFSEIAPRYDFITRALSFGRDTPWKRTLMRWLPEDGITVCVDLACGTGDIAFLLAQKYPAADITGLDITEPMLELARDRNTHANLHFMQGDMAALPLPAHSVDIVTGGYALRNAPDLGVTLGEIYRVLKPGGIAAFLDFSKPNGCIGQRIEYSVLKLWTGMWGVLLHRNHEVYSYIAESLDKFPARTALRRLLQAYGFRIQRSRLNFFGITEILLVQKNPSRG